MASEDSNGSRAVDSTKTQPKSSPPQPFLPLNVVFYLCLLANTLAAALSPIQDCDEVFNYWEPTHYLAHGYGLQTWEYSPEYSIRSWLYISFHAIVAKASSLFTRTKAGQFYFVRMVLALICTGCETRLFSAISLNLDKRIGVLFLVAMLFSPGIFHASTALLPSSFAMYSSMLGLAAFLDWNRGLNTPRAIMWFGVGAVIGWPFAGALVLPFLLDEVIVGVKMGSIWSTVSRMIRGVVNCLLVLGLEVAADTGFYRKLVVVPWNIVSYNVFGGEGKGPDNFGTEPWTFYLRNLLLNFNIWSMLAISTGPLLILQAAVRSHKTSKETILRSVTFVLPFYMWLAIFTLQPHKEERFMYPAYPFLALNAAISAHLLLSYIGSSDPKEIMGRVPLKLKMFVAVGFFLLAASLGLARITGVVTAYNAPLRIFEVLEKPGVASPGDYVCLGKEWYRFPSSFFLPDGLRAKFIKSEFRGLLPGEFAEGGSGLDLFPGTWVIPPGMNDRNQEDLNKYTDLSNCSFLMDSYFPGDQASELEPHYVLQNETWEKVSCRKFLDSRRTGILGRTLWIPNFPFIPKRFRRVWAQYCLLRRRRT